MSGANSDWLFERVEEQLQHRWSEIREVYANSKGSTYEQTLSDFLSAYFGGVYDINTKVAIIDPNLVSFQEFDFVRGNDEIDLVASFTQSNPRIIFKTGQGKGELKWVPLEGVAFICEVKSQLTKQSLTDDFEKLDSISRISDGVEDRFGMTVGGSYTINDPLQCLVYDKASIANDTFEKLLGENYSHWHMVLLVENNVLLLNRNLPISELFTPVSDESLLDIPPQNLAYLRYIQGVDIDPDFITLDNGLFWFLVSLSSSIPQPMSVNTANSLLALAPQHQWFPGVKTDIEEGDNE